MIGSFAATWAKLHDSSKPTIAAVAGWCIAGGTNIAFNAHLIVAAESARFGYPPSRVWGVPEAPWTWVARMGTAGPTSRHASRFGAVGEGSAFSWPRSSRWHFPARRTTGCGTSAPAPASGSTPGAGPSAWRWGAPSWARGSAPSMSR